MLQSMRDGAKGGILKFILLGFMAFAVGGLVLMDVGGFFRGGISSNTIAKGAGISIGVTDFDRTVRRVLARQGIGPQEAYRLGLIHTILTGEIQQRLMTKKARQLGLRPGDDLVTEQINKLAEPLETGNLSKKDALRQILRSQGISESEFIASIRQEMGNAILRGSLASGGGLVPDMLASDMYRYENQTREVKAIILKDDTVTGVTQPTDENLEKYYEANKIEYMIPATRVVTMATLRREMIEDEVKITDDDIKQAYEANISNFTKPEQRRLQQAVLSTPADAEKIAAKAKAGKSLKDAVKDVTGGTDAYLGEEAFQQSGLLEEIGAPVFAAKEGDVIGPVQTALGWHVLVLTKILQPQTVPLETVKQDIKDQLMQDRLADDILNAANALDDRLAGGEELESVVNDMGLTTEKMGPFRETGFTPDGKDLFKSYESDRGQILENAFGFEQGEITPVMELADGRFVVLRIDEASEVAYKPFDEVRDDLRKKWIKEQRALLNKTRAMEAQGKIESGASLAEAAKELGAKVDVFAGLKRGDKAPKALGDLALGKIFASKSGETFLSQTDGGILIAEVTDISYPAEDKVKPSDLELVKQAESRTFTQEILQQFMGDLTRHSTIKVNEAMLARLYSENSTN